MDIEANGKRARASSSSSLTGGDRLSSLPDCLIHHIMSFMKARQVVQTCVLSTRWKHLWRSVPCLDIDVEEFETTGSNPPREAWGKFEDFTDHLLIPNNISIALLDTFCLHVSGMYKSYRGQHATRWIRHGIKYSTRAPGMQRQGLSSSSWHLRKLYLSNLYLDDNFTEHVSSGCQNLEDLELKGCYCRTFHEISSHSLKNIILKDCEFSKLSAITSPALKSLVIESDGYSRIPSLLVITAPAVAYLLLDVTASNFYGGVSFEEMPSLGKASIHLRCDEVESKLSQNQLKLLCSVSNVTSLVLSGFTTMVLGEDPVTFPNFRNLRTLLLDNCDLSDNFKTLEHFLKNSPDLEKLTLRCCKNLKHTEIIYRDDDVRLLVELLLTISANLPKNNIKLTKVD
ncbi:hypothetical protein PVAP13_7KG165200 [Panicum virgatum]|uniref:F-box domain-containing protein n=1 Tax=Panicum virgatum TaxID=38727 RepID=A0A8T0QE73_PANVG|nr:hypothetical protein PVAP13_7KG165200 [Panicum virgatum]